MNASKLFVISLALVMFAAVGMAVSDDTTTTETTQTQVQHGPRFVDADGDGICDNAGTNGKGLGNGKGFVDADGDGVCDNKGTGQGLRRGKGAKGTGANFIDRNNDGICDNMGKGYTQKAGGLQKRGNAAKVK